MAEIVKRSIQLFDVRVDPRIGAVGTAPNHRPEVSIEFDSKQSLFHEAAQAGRHVPCVRRNDGASKWLVPAKWISRRVGHREHPQTVGSQYHRRRDRIAVAILYQQRLGVYRHLTGKDRSAASSKLIGPPLADCSGGRDRFERASQIGQAIEVVGRQEIVGKRERRLHTLAKRLVVGAAKKRVEPDKPVATPRYLSDLMFQDRRISPVPNRR